MPSSLPISRLINVSVNLAPPPAQSQSLSALLILGSSTVIDVVTRMRQYTSLTQVATDFGTSAVEYLAANLWFQQNPQPVSLLIGRWAKTASKGQLFGGPLSAANSLIGAWSSIANGSFKVTIDGGSQQSLLSLNFTGQTTLNGIATIINGTLTGAVCAYDAVNNRFFFTSNTTGAASTVTFLVTGASGTDISAMLVGLASSSGAYVANGIVAESALASATLFDQTFGQQWYALVIPEAIDADHQAVGPFIEATTTYHLYGVTTQSAGVLSSASTTDIAFLLKALLLNRTCVQYSSTSPYAVVSLLARMLTTDWTGNKTAITLMYKQEPGIVAEVITSTQISALEAKSCNVFVAYNNATAIIEQGVTTTGQFIDTIVGAAALAVGIQTALYNFLLTSATKVPQTDEGMHLLVNVVSGVCLQFETNGLLGPGTWTTNGFGALNGPGQGGNSSVGDFMPTGWYVYAPPVATQSQANRAARFAVPIQVAAKLAGAVHTASVSIAVNP